MVRGSAALVQAIGRLSAVGVSGAVHAAVLFTSLGHPSAAGRPAGAPMTVDVEVENAPAPPAPLPEAEEESPRDNHAAAFPTHTHPYPVPADHDLVPHDPSLVHVMHHDHDEAHDAPPQADTTHVVTADSDVPRFAITFSAGAPGAGGVAVHASDPSGTATAPVNPGAGGARGGDDDGILAERAVDTRARLAHGVTPVYPSGAQSAGIEARVGLELVVSAEGSVEDARVVRPAGHGLDEAALKAARQFRFAPAMKSGRAVRVRMDWSVDFRLD